MAPTKPLPRSVSIIEIEIVTGQAMEVHEGSEPALPPIHKQLCLLHLGPLGDQSNISLGLGQEGVCSASDPS